MSKKVLLNSGAQFLGKFLTMAAGLLVVKILTGFGREFYGKYRVTYEFLAFFGILADAGLFSIAVREMSKFPKKSAKIFGNIFSLRIFFIFFFSFLAIFSAQFIKKYSPEVRLGIFFTAASMALTMLAGTFSAILQSRMKIYFFSAALVFSKIFLAAEIFLLAQNANFFFEKNFFFAALAAGVFANLIFCAAVFLAASREIKIWPQFDFQFWKKILKISLPYGLALILQTLYLRIDIILISIILGEKSVGIYGVAAQILESFLVLGVFFGQSILPKFSENEKNKNESSKIFCWGAEKLLIFSLPIVIGLTKFAPEIVQILSNEKFLSAPNFFGSDQILQILAPTIFFAFLNQLFTFALVSKNRQNFLLLVNFVAVILNIFLNTFFLQKFGLAAAAASTIFCEIIVFLFLIFAAAKNFSAKFFSVKNFLIIFFANFLLFCQFYLTPIGKNFIISAAIGGASYAGIFFFFRRKFF